jgi:hypothetical protein
MKKRKSDILWKVIMEEVFADLLRFLFADADQVYNMERGFEYLDKELSEMDPQPDEEKDTRFADKLVKVYHRDGEEEWILLHIEIQGDTYKKIEFSERMYQYFYRIRDRYKKPVSALAIFTGLNGRDMPDRYVYEYRGTCLTYRYPTLSILDFSDEELAESNNPFAYVIRAARTALLEKKIPGEDLLQLKLLIARELQRKGFGRAKTLAILNFLRNYILFENPELNLKFDEGLRPNDKFNAMNTIEYLRMEGKEEGLEEGRIEKEIIFVRKLLAATDFSDEKIADLADVSLEFVKEVRKGKISN